MISSSSLSRVARAAVPIALVMLTAGLAAACPNCKEGLAQNDPQGQAIAAGFYYSILFMMAMPFAIVATFGGLAYLSIRRARLHDLAGAASVEAEPNPEP